MTVEARVCLPRLTARLAGSHRRVLDVGLDFIFGLGRVPGSASVRIPWTLLLILTISENKYNRTKTAASPGPTPSATRLAFQFN